MDHPSGVIRAASGLRHTTVAARVEATRSKKTEASHVRRTKAAFSLVWTVITISGMLAPRGSGHNR